MHGSENQFYDLEDMPRCRYCGAKPVVKGDRTANGCGSTRLQCPVCGIRTGQSTSEQWKYIVWKRVMG